MMKLRSRVSKWLRVTRTSLSLNEDAHYIPFLSLMLFLVYSMQSLSKYKLNHLDIYMILGKV